ncbi:MAG TPA: metalloregulator ArsR/SmtB family transcription factor [Egibacteraceae bacterium]
MDVEQVPERLAVLAEPNRFRIVELLRSGPRSVGEIVEALGLAQPHVSRHLRILHDAGLVQVRPQAQRRIYSLRRAPFEELNAWFTAVTAIWSERMDRLDAYLQQVEAQETA